MGRRIAISYVIEVAIPPKLPPDFRRERDRDRLLFPSTGNGLGSGDGLGSGIRIQNEA